MTEKVLRINHLGKRYRIGEQQSYLVLRDVITRKLTESFRKILGKKSIHSREKNDFIWAIKDISFDVDRGDVIGIIGNNGAGKSTLLKILSRITSPTTGSVEIEGRIGSLLEVGTGFHPELTGRENIYLNGAILGLKKHEINRKFDEIVAFSEIEKFLDTPIKYYSSGMYVRLAFSVAAHLEAEILLVDEVLAVGDVLFQRKCLGKMKDVASEGRTVLFVSHNMVAVQNLCDRVIWIEKGRIVRDGDIDEVITEYLKRSFSNTSEKVWENMEKAPGNEKISIHRAKVIPGGGTTSDAIYMHTEFEIEIEFWNKEPGVYIDITIHLNNEQGVIVLGSSTSKECNWHGKPFKTGLYRTRCKIPGNLLNSGRYSVMLLLVKNQSSVIFKFENIVSFDIIDSVESRDGWFGKRVGVVRPNLIWESQYIGNLRRG